MPVESAADLAGLYADFAEAGTLSLAGAGGQVVAVRVILETPEEPALGDRMVTPRFRARLAAASLAARPRDGDTLTLPGVGVFRVAGAPQASADGAEFFLTLSS